MSKNIRTQIGKVIGKTLNSYHARVKPVIDDIKFKEQYQGRIIDCMVGEVDDNYIETPETDAPIVKLEHSKEGIVKVPSIKGKTILIDSEGNETDTPAEGCRLVSVGEDEGNKLIILSKNKNLFDKQVKENYCLLHNTDGSVYESPNASYCISDYIKLPSNTNIKISSLSWARVYLYNDKKQVVNFIIGQGTQSFEFNMGQSCFIRLSFAKSDLDTLQLSINASNTEYVEPKSHKTEILLDEPLRSLPNGVCDEIIGNKLIRRVGFTNLNGVKQWWHHWNDIELQNGSNDDYYVGSNGVLIKCTNKKILKSNRLQKIGLYEPNLGYINAGGANEFGIRIPMNLLTERTEEEFKNWINSNNIQVMYELAEPIIEELPNSITLQGFDDTTIYVENSITPTISYGYNALIPYKEELRTQKEEVETNTLDIENNIIPYLTDMEYNLMLMEDN